jgi:hypothetical protein
MIFMTRGAAEIRGVDDEISLRLVHYRMYLFLFYCSPLQYLCKINRQQDTR